MPSSEAELNRARSLILNHGQEATCYQISNPGILRYRSSETLGLVGYGESRSYWVTAGAPIGPRENRTLILAEFIRQAHRAGRRVSLFGVEKDLVDQLRVEGFVDRLLLGAQPVWDPRHWPKIVRQKASLRYQLHRASNKNVVVAEWETQVASEHSALRDCLNRWLGERGLPPLHFLVEPSTLSRLKGRRIFVANQGVTVVGFLVLSPIPLRNGWLVEQIIRSRVTPNGTAELLLDCAWRRVAAEGTSMVTLGLSPLSRRAGFKPHHHPLLRGLLWILRSLGRKFYNFEGLDRFKAKFQPESWEPIYALTINHRISFATLWSFAEVFGQCSPWSLLAKAIGRKTFPLPETSRKL